MLCLWSDQSEFMVLFMVLVHGLVQVLFSNFVDNFYFAVAIFWSLPLGLDLFSDAYLNSLLLL